MDKLDEIVGFPRIRNAGLVGECQNGGWNNSKETMVFYLKGYCRCSLFYYCKYQGAIKTVPPITSGDDEIIQAKCTRDDKK